MNQLGQIMSDPEFLKKAPEVKRAILSKVDPGFLKLSEEAQAKVIDSLGGSPLPSPPAQNPQDQTMAMFVGEAPDKELGLTPFTPPADPRQRAFRQDVPEWRRTASKIYHPLLEGTGYGLGAVAGATAGLPAGPVGSALAGVGLSATLGGTGRLMAEWLDEKLGLRSAPKSNKDALMHGLDVARESTETALAGEIGGNLVTRGITRAISPHHKFASTPEAAYNRQLSEEFDVPLTPGQVTGKPSLNRKEAVLHRDSATTDASEAFVQKQQSRFKDAATKIQERYPAVEDDVMGAEVKAGLKRESDAQFKEAQRRYFAVGASLPGGGQIPLTNLKDQVKTLLKQFNTLPKEFRNDLLQDKSFRQAYSLTKEKSLTWEEAQYVRTVFNKNIMGHDGSPVAGYKGASDSVGGFYKQMRQALDKDMGEYAKSMGPEIFSKYESANQFYRNFKQTFGKNSPGLAMMKKDPEVIGEHVFQMHNGKIAPITRLRTVQKVFGKESEEMDQIRSYFLDRILLKEGATGNLPFGQMNTTMKKYGDQFIRELFDDKTYSLMRRQADLGMTIDQAVKKYGNPSGTAQVMMAFLTGANKLMHPVRQTAYYLSRKGMGQTYFSDVGRAWRSEALGIQKNLLKDDLKGVQKAFSHIGKLGQILGRDDFVEYYPQPVAQDPQTGQPVYKTVEGDLWSPPLEDEV